MSKARSPIRQWFHLGVWIALSALLTTRHRALSTQGSWVVAEALSQEGPPAFQLAEFPNGLYQFCSQPDPQDWRDGEGVCLMLRKQDRLLQGYYGYPHSDEFICLGTSK
ncbi:hypothetical protein [Lyngbya confervoides]|uniref:Uncharacterized protein n=1 Tax=Lyngbya confervoides BDU141951 TaxID=1574623 RepID=A0ABD4T6Y1_9CYAN|nr:hypothetical protein [Lyngbya confervoides]MCM1984483.1 hypothetical protein [Lyngbya confervoides BDU141951]